MLILSRKLNESIVINGNIMVKVLRVEGEVVKLGIQAPPTVPVHRQEVYEEIQKSNQEALTRGRPKLPKVVRAVAGSAAGSNHSAGTPDDSPAKTVPASSSRTPEQRKEKEPESGGLILVSPANQTNTEKQTP